jgi:hypothetical protein
MSLTARGISQSSTSRGAPYAPRQLSGCDCRRQFRPCSLLLHPASPIQSSRVPHHRQVCSRVQCSLGVTEGGLTNPTTPDRAKQDDEHSEMWVFRFLSSDLISRRDSSRMKTNPFSPLVLFFPPRHLGGPDISYRRSPPH